MDPDGKIHVSDAHTRTADDVLALLGSGPGGLSRAEAEERLRAAGPNALPEPEATSIWTVFGRQFLSPLIYVLFVAAIVSALLREFTDAGFIFAVLIINAIIGTLQEHHAQRSAEALRKMISSQCRVVREGESFEVDSRDLAPGDLALLEAGARVPADIRLSGGLGLQIDESLLTGESVPIDKNAAAVVAADAPVAERANMAFAGSIVSRGRGQGVVVATGTASEMGKLAGSLAGQKEPKPPLIRRMEQFTIRIAMALGVIIFVMGTIEFARGASWNDVLIVSVALAVSAIPEGLPVAVTVALAIGMNRMARRNVIVRQLVAMETLGSCTMVASDKTGTLTLNELTCRTLAAPGRDAWEITGTGVAPEGELRTPRGPLTAGEAEIAGRLARVAALCNEGFLGLRDGEWTGHGDSVDVALLSFAHKAGVNQNQAQSENPICATIPYESELGFAASLHKEGEARRICVKGAFERLLPMCVRMAGEAGDRPLEPETLRRQSEALARSGHRVLAFAEGRFRSDQDQEFAEEHLSDLTFLGFVGMIDPLRPESRDAIAACRASGLQVAMVTGDHPTTARSIAEDLDLIEAGDRVVEGRDIRAAMAEGPGAMDALTRDSRVFARVEPRQKLEIVRALESQGNFVAVTGDGVNDAPALTAAHAGVAMGKRGTDVARESAQLIVTDDNFASIVAGIEEGRIAYRNIRKVIFLLISTGAAEIVLFILSMGFGLPIPLTAVQLLWLNLATNGLQDVALAFEPGEGDEMRQPPRPPGEPIFNRLMIERVVVSALVMGTLGFLAFRHLLLSGVSESDARNSLLLLMVLFENVHIGNCRSETRSAFALSPLRNSLLLAGTIGAQALHIAAMHTPGLSTILGARPVSIQHWVNLLGVALCILVAMELHKLFHYVLRGRKKPRPDAIRRRS